MHVVDEKNTQKPLKEQFNFFLVQLGSTLITGFFLALWVSIQYGVGFVIQWLEPSGINQLMLWIFQGIFATTTLIPIIVYYYVDTRIIFLRAKKKIIQEQSQG